MNTQIEKTGLWSSSLGTTASNAETQQKLEHLRSVLQRFRGHVAILTTRIAAQFPQLTIHDVTHLDALWETADLIAGPGYPLNPMEAFVLGGAILLHDAAHCFEAYEGGRDAVRATTAWKDAYAAEIAKNPNGSTDDSEQYCDFAAIRLLHARQAEKLGEREWKSANDHTALFLIEDSDLRARFGSLIGKIAASHNWSIEDVVSRLPDQFNAPGNWPSEWRVDPIKIACLLRCADAAHLDDRRAPDFLLALIRRSGISLDHWKAQNWLARADLDQSDRTKSSLRYTSTRAFKPNDTKAWWVVYDAISVLESEISSSNKLLSSRTQSSDSSPPFKIKKVTGTNSPIELSKSIQVEDWTPTSAKIHVGNIEKLVGTLGGSSLYGNGDHFAIVLRELIQNARDAISARRAFASNFKGSILVKITQKSPIQTYIEVQDDGIGMSERTMVGALLDFGTSFWASDLVQSEFPGLRSSSFRPVGKYGIGFYSVFMVASEVHVASRRFDAGVPDVTNLHFADGITLRPVLSKGANESYDTMCSTCVRITVNEPIEDVRTRLMIQAGGGDLRVPLKNYLAAITAGLDVQVGLQDTDGLQIIVHESILELTNLEKISDWIKCLSFLDLSDALNNIQTNEYVEKNFDRIRKIEQDGKLVGLAALLDVAPNTLHFVTTETIGGLTNNVNRGMGSFLGYMDNYPESAKRDSYKKVISSEKLQLWANEQIAILRARNLTPIQLYWMASNMSNLDIDPIEIINFPVLLDQGRYMILNLDQVLEILQSTGLSSPISRHADFCETNVPPFIVNELPTLRPITNGNLIRFAVENGRAKYPTSFLGCLERMVLRNGQELTYETKTNIATTGFGPLDALIIKLKT